jgi:hypothetical protein
MIKEYMASTEAIKIVLHRVMHLCAEFRITEVFTPRIGCGLGGLNWESDVCPLFQETVQKHPEIHITICDFN